MKDKNLDNIIADDKNSAEKPEKGTNVLNDTDKTVSRETILTDTGFVNKYRLFRKSGISRRESLFNAAYLVCNNKYDETASDVKDKYKSVPEHPVGWSSDKEKLHKHNKWSVGMKLLSGVAWIINAGAVVKNVIGRFFRKIGMIPKSLDNSLRAVKAFFRITSKVILPITAIVFTLYAGNVIYTGMSENYTFGIYVDGVYKGNTDNVDSVIEARHAYERNLSERYGTPLVLQCDVQFKAQRYDKGTFYKPGDLSIYDEYVESYTERGYGLYIDNVLAAVSDSEIVIDRTVNDYIQNRRNRYLIENSLREDQIDKFVFSNHIVVVAADYPKTYFLDENELRKLFDLPEKQNGTAVGQLDVLQIIKKEYLGDGNTEISGDGEFSYSINLDYSKLDRIDSAELHGLNMDNTLPSASVTVDIAIARDEVIKEYIPFGEEIIEDNTMLEGMRRLVTKGRDGEKLIYCKSTYQGNKLMSREVVGEEIIKSPINKVVRVGTKEATDEEKALLPTGKYIYPYKGTITSYYGWRQLRGQNNYHQGLDIFGSRGDPVVASDGGEVIDVGYTSGYGNYCLIRHNEEIVTRYAHCDSIDVEVGDFVGKGYMIGTLGATGNVTGVHVHFEIIKNGKTVDPLPYMSEPELPYAW